MWEPQNKQSCRPSAEKPVEFPSSGAQQCFRCVTPTLHLLFSDSLALHLVSPFLPIIQVTGTKFISRLIELYNKRHRYRKYPLSKYHSPVWKDLKKCPVLKVNSVKIKSRGNLFLSTAFFFLDTDQNFTQGKHKLHFCFFFWDVELLQLCLIERTLSKDERCQ